MLVYIQLHQLRYVSCIDYSLHSSNPLGQHSKYSVIYIVVNQYNPICCLPYQICHKSVCIIYLPVKEYPLYRCLLFHFLHQQLDLIIGPVYFLIQLQLVIFQDFNPT